MLENISAQIKLPIDRHLAMKITEIRALLPKYDYTLLANVSRMLRSNGIRGIALARRSISDGCSSAKLKSLKAKQLAMQRDDGLPVYLKGGTKDKIFYNLTVGLTIFGLFNSFQYMYFLATHT